MKRINLLLVGLACLFMVTSCNNEPELPFDTFEDLTYGAYARLLSSDGNFFLTDIDGSSYTFEVEFYDENQGQEVDSYSWVVEHQGELGNHGPVDIMTVPSSSFQTNSNGLPGTTITFTFPQVLDALGITAADVSGGDSFVFNATVRKKDGREFTAANTGTNIIGSAAYRGWFSFPLQVLCTSSLDGTYDAVTTVTNQSAGIFWDGCEGSTWEGQVRLEQVGDGVYDVYSISADGTEFLDASMGAFIACYGSDDQGGFPNTGEAGDVQLTDACERMGFRGSSQWGEIYSASKATVDGANFTFGWINDYGEGGETILTRTDGTDWPPLKL